MKPSIQLRHLVNKLNRELKVAHKKTLKQIKNDTIKSQSIHLISQLDLNHTTNNIFLDDKIKHYIINNSNYSKQLYMERKIKITITDEEPISDKYFYYILDWLNFILPYADKSCIKTLHINIFLTPFKKLLPEKSEIIGPYHVNSGSTTSCTISNSTILIWRKEEWFKVLMHESFHYFKLDFSHSHDSSFMKNLFNIDSDFLMNEAYCETWATILHTIFYAFYNNETIWNLLQKERMHAIEQTIHILQHMDLTYDDIISPQYTNKYKEHTNVFCYYIAKMILLFHINQFIKWCPIDKYLNCKKPLYLFFKKYYNNPTLLNEIHNIKQVPYSLKMCYLDIL